jgi:hypothetical protein
MYGPGIKSRWGRDFPRLPRPALGPTQPSVQWVPGLPQGKERPERDADPSPFSSAVGHERVELYFYSPCGPYRASVPVQGCTLPFTSVRTCNVTLRRVCLTVCDVKKSNKYYIFWGWVYRLWYPARKAHEPYRLLWPVWLYHIFSHYLINGTIFGKKLLNMKCVFWFSVQHLSEKFLLLRRIQRDINVHVSTYKVLVILVRY